MMLLFSVTTYKEASYTNARKFEEAEILQHINEHT